jgi:uncharacterized protein DUF6933
VVVRCTAKALKLLGLRPATFVEIEAGDDDWYLNLLWFDRRKCLLVAHAGTAFSVFVPDVRKVDLDPIGPFLVQAITAALDDETLPVDVLGILDPADARIAKTASRRVLGIMNDVAHHLDYMVGRYGSVLDVDVITVNRQLQRTLHTHGGDYRHPIDLVRERMAKTASAGFHECSVPDG